MTEYVKISRKEYDELKQIKECIELLKANGLPDDTQFVVMTKQGFDRNQKQYELLYNGKLEEKENTINIPNYYKLKLEDLKEWLEEEIKNCNPNPQLYFKAEDNIKKHLYKEVLERLG